MQNDNNRITAILTALLVLIMVVVFFVGVGFLVRGLFNGSDRNLVAGAGQTFLGGGSMALGGNVLSAFTNPQACSEGQYTRWTGVAWTCSTDRVGGERGPQGPQGPQGPAGPPGISYGSGGGTTFGGVPQTCYSGQYSRWTGSYWTCETDRTGGSSYNNYNDDYDPDVVRPQSCSSGQYSRWTGSFWTCESRGNSGSGSGQSYFAGTGLELNGDTFSLRGLQACSSGQYSRWTGSSWTCATDQNSGSGGNNNNDDYDPDVVRPQACSSGQYSRWTGSSWTCATDQGNGGNNGGNTSGTIVINIGSPEAGPETSGPYFCPQGYVATGFSCTGDCDGKRMKMYCSRLSAVLNQ